MGPPRKRINLVDAEDATTIFTVLREAKPAEVTVASIVVVPIILGAWASLLGSIGVPDEWQQASLGIVLLIYISGILIMKMFAGRDTQEERARQQL